MNVIELSSSVLINALFYQFTNSPKAAPLLFGTLLVQGGSQALVAWKVKNREAAETLSPNLFAFIAGSYMHTLIHEIGHALASKMVFKNPRPKITLFPFTEGRTKFETRELTYFGRQLGQPRALAFAAGAGPGISLLVSSLAMLVGKAVQNRFPKLALYFMAYGKSDLFAHAAYVLSANFTSNFRMSHDFFLLSKVGIHPSAIAAIFVVIPLLIEFRIR
jgi:hypothetical protein